MCGIPSCRRRDEPAADDDDDATVEAEVADSASPAVLSPLTGGVVDVAGESSTVRPGLTPDTRGVEGAVPGGASCPFVAASALIPGTGGRASGHFFENASTN